MIVADGRTDVSAALGQVCWPTLVIHNPANVIVPFDEGRLVAAGIPGARFRTIDSRNILPLPGEPGFDELLRMIDEFMREDGQARHSEADVPAGQSVRGGTLQLIDAKAPTAATARRGR